MAVPYRSLELGLQELLTTVNREIYPADKYPFGQWSYQAHYERAFDSITAFYDSEPEGWLKLCHRPGAAENLYLPSHTARTAEDGGPGGGPTKLPKPPAATSIPHSLLDDDKLAAYGAAFKRTGFYGTNALYMNHDRNRAYNTNQAVNNARLDFPVLFIEAKYDTVCAVHTTSIAETQRKLCSSLTEVIVEAGHWLQLEKPHEVNAALAKWLVSKLGDHWPSPTVSLERSSI